jgi:hypothetical protein
MKDKYPEFPDHIRKVLRIMSTRSNDIDTFKMITNEVDGKKNVAASSMDVAYSGGVA